MQIFKGNDSYICAVKKSGPVILENILVEDYAAEGKSLAKVDGKVIFIENAVPGDVVDVRIFKNKKDWAVGAPQLFKKYSPQRTLPFCEHFGTCGGCQWQMLPYDRQLYYKHKQVTDNLQRIGKMSLPEVLPIIGCNNTRRYRNKLEYTFSAKEYIPPEAFRRMKRENSFPEQRTGAAGFHAKGIFDKIVNINICHLQEEPTNLMRKAVADYARKNDLSFYNIKEHTGFLRNMLVRISAAGEIMVNLVLGYEDEELRKPLLDYLLEKFSGLTTLLYTVNTKWNDSLHDLEPVTYFGRGYIIEKLGDVSFKISAKSFFQTNTRQAEKLYKVVADFAGLNGMQNVYDLYCGTGSIGIFLSGKAKKLIGVELSEDAINDARENAVMNGISHASFFAGDVNNICTDDFFIHHGSPDVIITDPPRVGMQEKLVNTLLKISAPLIVYVSCNPATQARDLLLIEEKYTVEKIQPVDMFPHTLHIENVVQLKLK